MMYCIGIPGEVRVFEHWVPGIRSLVLTTGYLVLGAWLYESGIGHWDAWFYLSGYLVLDI